MPDCATRIIDGVYWVGVNDHDTPLFEGLWALPHGMSYNAYLVRGREKTALIELVKSDYADQFIRRIEEVVPLDSIDYIIHNHMEPDHSGSIPVIYERCPKAEVFCTAKAKSFLDQFYGVGERVTAVNDGDRIDLGGKTLKFLSYPWLHWPDSMFTYLEEDKVLFPCDAFGGFGAVDEGLFDDQWDLEAYWPESRRYLGTIVASYLPHVVKAIDKWVKGGMGISVLCPSHGPVYRQNPMAIISRYQEWASNQRGQKVVMVVGSMWGNTHRMGQVVKQRLLEKGLEVAYFDAATAEPGAVLGEMLNAGGIVFGAPTYDANIYPRLEYYLMLFKSKKKTGYPVGVFTQNSWNVNILPKVEAYLQDMKAEIVQPEVVGHGAPDAEVVQALQMMADALAIRITNPCACPVSN
ncbi:MAG: FprA family A-type flavoprotein [Deltaproteobacteria bacterium]|nr:FprA family A-type flavoprotein [Candidatus Anaeroferrophillus wilburensis]MBN2888312.1 FprA family A-type flavoprotein [Deltaproteobacteria bacterium]